jgi:hypothetical protein
MLVDNHDGGSLTACAPTALKPLEPKRSPETRPGHSLRAAHAQDLLGAWAAAGRMNETESPVV